MIKNFMCESCEKFSVCLVYRKLRAFTEDAKTDLGVNLTMNDCDNFSEEKDN